MALLVVVAALAIIARKISIPYPILLVVAGLALALIPGLPHVHLAPNLIFLIFLPPLLYPAALFTSWREFHANLWQISMLAVGLVLFTTCAVGIFAHHWVAGLSLPAAFALGAIVSPPDAVAATSIITHLRVPRRIVAILEGESLVNDAIALVAYRFAIAAMMTGSFSLALASERFLWVAMGGVLIGYLVGLLAARVQGSLDDPPVQITISLLTPYVAYLAAERVEASGVLAVVTAGLFLGWRAPEVIGSRMRLQAFAVWETVIFLLNGLVFVLIGLQLPEVMRGISAGSQGFFRPVIDALVISALVIVVRFMWVFAVTYVPRLFIRKLRARHAPSWRHVTIVAWTGMRGVVSLAAAMALPGFGMEHEGDIPGHDLILFFTFVVILVTLVLQGLTLPYLIRTLKVVGGREREKEEREARLKANLAGLERLSQLESDKVFPAQLIQRLRVEYEERIQQLEALKPEETQGTSRIFSQNYIRLQEEALRVERQTILRLRNELVINDDTLRRVQHDLDLAEERLRAPD